MSGLNVECKFKRFLCEAMLLAADLMKRTLPVCKPKVLNARKKRKNKILIFKMARFCNYDFVGGFRDFRAFHSLIT